MTKYVLALRYLGLLVVAGIAALVLQNSVQESTVEFHQSPQQVTADNLMAQCEPASGELPSAVVVMPEGESEPRVATGQRMIHETLEQTFNGADYGHVIFGFCK